MTQRQLSIPLINAAQTTELAAALAPFLAAGDTILLEGSVGAGKTHFARSLIKAILPAPEDVPSPTFTLVQTYDTDRGSVWHADLYRISSVYEIEELGLLDAIQTAICLIEWPDRLAEFTPKDALTITLTDGETDDARVLNATWQNPAWNAKLTSWTK